MNNLGIENNRFFQKAQQNRNKTDMSGQYSVTTQKKKKNEHYEKWLQQKELEQNVSTETCLEIITPNLPQAKIPNSFQVKLIHDILKKQHLKSQSHSQLGQF